MRNTWSRREFLLTSTACAACPLVRFPLTAAGESKSPEIVSPGCVGSRVRVAKLYLGVPKALWPTPKLDLEAEMQRYESEIRRMPAQFADIDFTGNRLITEAGQASAVRAALEDCDGVLLIHLSMGVSPILAEIMKARKPTVLFAAPYSGHEWTSFGALRAADSLFDCILSSDPAELAAAVRPFRAIHHLRETKILNVSTRQPAPPYLEEVSRRFGARIQTVDDKPVLAAYDSISQAEAEAEAKSWITQAERVVEPPREEIVRSCRLALAFEKLVAQEKANVITVDCYGSMYRKLPAFPCVGFVRLNDRGLGGICESDLQSALGHVMMQGLSGRPGFISDPTMDSSTGGIILAHCLGPRKMDGPEGETAPYRLRTIMERQEGCVPQVRMRTGQRVTQLRLVGAEKVLYFTGRIIAAPDTDRGCRTQILVKVDGDPEKLWQNWSSGLHRQTVYGDITADLRRFCRIKGLAMVDECA